MQILKFLQRLSTGSISGEDALDQTRSDIKALASLIDHAHSQGNEAELQELRDMRAKIIEQDIELSKTLGIEPFYNDEVSKQHLSHLRL